MPSTPKHLTILSSMTHPFGSIFELLKVCSALIGIGKIVVKNHIVIVLRYKIL